MTFEAQELPTFSIKRFNLQNVLNFNNTLPGHRDVQRGGANGTTVPGIQSEITKITFN